MATIATAELTLSDIPPDEAFARFIDFSVWDLWMPKGMRPITGPARQLREGDTFTIALGARGLPALPSKLEVIRLRPNKEICWRGGVRGVLVGEHSFLFEAADVKGGRGTRIRSEEPFSGVLASGPLSALLEREAVRVGESTLSGFAEFVAKRRDSVLPPA